MDLRVLLDCFRSEDIAAVLRNSGLPVSGTKRQRIDRLIALTKHGRSRGETAEWILGYFDAEHVERVCTMFGIYAEDRVQMAFRLAEGVTYPGTTDEVAREEEKRETQSTLFESAERQSPEPLEVGPQSPGDAHESIRDRRQDHAMFMWSAASIGTVIGLIVAWLIGLVVASTYVIAILSGGGTVLVLQPLLVHVRRREIIDQSFAALFIGAFIGIFAGFGVHLSWLVIASSLFDEGFRAISPPNTYTGAIAGGLATIVWVRSTEDASFRAFDDSRQVGSSSRLLITASVISIMIVIAVVTTAVNQIAVEDRTRQEAER